LFPFFPTLLLLLLLELSLVLLSLLLLELSLVLLLLLPLLLKKIDNAEDGAKRCFLFEKFIDDLLAQGPGALQRPASDGCDSSALPRQIDHGIRRSCGDSRNAPAWPKSHGTRY